MQEQLLAEALRMLQFAQVGPPGASGHMCSGQFGGYESLVACVVVAQTLKVEERAGQVDWRARMR